MPNDQSSGPRLFGMPLEAVLRTGTILVLLGIAWGSITTRMHTIEMRLNDVVGAQQRLADKVDRVIEREINNRRTLIPLGPP